MQHFNREATISINFVDLLLKEENFGVFAPKTSFSIPMRLCVFVLEVLYYVIIVLYLIGEKIFVYVVGVLVLAYNPAKSGPIKCYKVQSAKQIFMSWPAKKLLY